MLRNTLKKGSMSQCWLEKRVDKVEVVRHREHRWEQLYPASGVVLRHIGLGKSKEKQTRI
jgi:hypothetical protein